MKIRSQSDNVDKKNLQKEKLANHNTQMNLEERSLMNQKKFTWELVRKLKLAKNMI